MGQLALVHAVDGRITGKLRIGCPEGAAATSEGSAKRVAGRGVMVDETPARKWDSRGRDVNLGGGCSTKRGKLDAVMAETGGGLRAGTGERAASPSGVEVAVPGRTGRDRRGAFGLERYWLASGHVDGDDRRLAPGDAGMCGRGDSEPSEATAISTTRGDYTGVALAVDGGWEEAWLNQVVLRLKRALRRIWNLGKVLANAGGMQEACRARRLSLARTRIRAGVNTGHRRRGRGG